MHIRLLLNFQKVGRNSSPISAFLAPVQLTCLPDSIYAPIKDAVEGTRAGTELGKDAMAPARFAHGVVANAVNQKSQVWFWHGTKATLVWMITVFLPHTFLVSDLPLLLLRLNGLML